MTYEFLDVFSPFLKETRNSHSRIQSINGKVQALWAHKKMPLKIKKKKRKITYVYLTNVVAN